jgi:ATP-dependent DNA helicase PIF1
LEVSSILQWRRSSQEKAAKRLEKLNKDCSNTAGLEANLKVAVGARVMLRRNTAVKEGLVNGAIGTVLSILPGRISVKFDHLEDSCDIKRVPVMVMKNLYVQRTQFPLILAHSVTIHKCQGLSLDCAIFDLSDKVFADGVAYVALSRVRGQHLIQSLSR